MHLSDVSVSYLPNARPGKAMFHRRCQQPAPGAHFKCPANALAGNRNLMLRQLFFSGAVAACNMEVLMSKLLNDRCLPGIGLAIGVVN
jgi:hypothetical protein